MSNGLITLIDELQAAIKSYKAEKLFLQEVSDERNKLKSQIENCESGVLGDPADIDMLNKSLDVQNNTYHFVREHVEIKLYALQFKAYKLGRTRSRPEIEP
jgi:hypothetical protein